MSLLELNIGKFDRYVFLCMVAKKMQKKLWFDNRDQIDCDLKIKKIKMNATKKKNICKKCRDLIDNNPKI